MKVALKTTDQQLAELWSNTDKARSNARAITVNREALRNLLQDHHALCGVVGEDNLETKAA